VLGCKSSQRFSDMRLIVKNNCPNLKVSYKNVKEHSGRFDMALKDLQPLDCRGSDKGQQWYINYSEDGGNSFGAALAAGFSFGIASGAIYKAAFSMNCRTDMGKDENKQQVYRDFTVVVAWANYNAGVVSNAAGVQIRAGVGAEDEKGRLNKNACGVNATGDVTDVTAMLTNSFSGTGRTHSFTESTNFFDVTCEFTNQSQGDVVLTFTKN